MVHGFHYPEGDPDGLDSLSTSLGTVHTDLQARQGEVQSGVQQALSTWRATRSQEFEHAGQGISGALRGAASVIDAAQEQVSSYARRLREAREDIDELERQAQTQLARMDDLDPDDEEHDGIQRRVDSEVARLRREAQEIRSGMRSDASSTAGGLNAGTDILLPEGSTLTPDQVAQRVHGGTGVDGTTAALSTGRLSQEDAWGALSSVSEPARSLPERAVDSWLGFKPPSDQDPVSTTLYTLGQVQFASSSVADWMADGRYSHFRPIDAAGRTISTDMGFFQRMRYGAGRFPTAQGMTPWQRLRGFDPKGHFSARPWKGAAASRWSTTGKWLGRAGTVVTAGTSAWQEWNASANYPTDERVGRTVTKSAATTAGTYLGAKGGAWAGGAIGTAICPGVGTVIGIGVGALVGGFIGSQAGGWIGDQVKDIGGEVGDAVGDAMDKAGDVIDDLTPW